MSNYVDGREDYFDDWLERLSDEKERESVVNQKTARELVMNTLARDPSLANLVGHLENNPSDGLNTLLEGDFITNLISLNNAEKKLERRVQVLREKRRSLEQLIPKRQGLTRRKVINRFANNSVLEKYGVHRGRDKKGHYHYRDVKTGKFTSGDRVLKITDLVVNSSARKRKELEDFLERDIFGNKKR